MCTVTSLLLSCHFWTARCNFFKWCDNKNKLYFVFFFKLHVCCWWSLFSRSRCFPFSCITFQSPDYVSLHGNPEDQMSHWDLNKWRITWAWKILPLSIHTIKHLIYCLLICNSRVICIFALVKMHICIYIYIGFNFIHILYLSGQFSFKRLFVPLNCYV